MSKEERKKMVHGLADDLEEQQRLDRQKRLQRLGLSERDMLMKGEKLGTSIEDISDSGMILSKSKRRKARQVDPETGMTHAQELASRRMVGLLQFVIDNENKDTRLNNVEIVYIEMSKDYKSARVKWREAIGFLPFQEMKKKNALLEQAAGFLASRVAALRELRYAPKFDFFFDIDPRDTTVAQPSMKYLNKRVTKMGIEIELPTVESAERREREFVRYEDEVESNRKLQRRKKRQQRKAASESTSLKKKSVAKTSVHVAKRRKMKRQLRQRGSGFL